MNYKVPLIQTVTSTISWAAADAAVKAAIEALQIATTTVPNSINIFQLNVYNPGTLTFGYTIHYRKIENL